MCLRRQACCGDCLSCQSNWSSWNCDPSRSHAETQSLLDTHIYMFKKSTLVEKCGSYVSKLYSENCAEVYYLDLDKFYNNGLSFPYLGLTFNASI